MSQAMPTNEHGRIRQWAAVYGAVPVQVSSLLFDGEPAKLAFVFPQRNRVSEPEFTPISWEQFFAMFDAMELSVVFDESKPGTYEILQADGREQSGFAVGQS